MDSFYRSWLAKNERENKKAKEKLLQNIVSPTSTTINQPSTSSPTTSTLSPTTSTSFSAATSTSTPITTSNLVTSLPTISTSVLPSTSTLGGSTSRLVNESEQISDLIFENDQLQLFIIKEKHIKQIKFRLQDHIFHMKIRLKSGAQFPLLSDILNFLEIGFTHILENIKRFYKSEDHNVAFLTLYQEPMINGLNTGGFDIQENPSDMVDRVLKMLEQFLVSNQSLKLNKTFKVYLKVLSIEHMKFKNQIKQRIHPKRTQKFYKKHYGARSKTCNKYNYYWALDVPNSYPNRQNIFLNKCLLTTTLLGLLQHKYFESKRTDKRFIHIQNINSINHEKQNHAGRILADELEKLLNETQLPQNGPYELEATTKKLSEIYNCQFFIFNDIFNSKKINFMYPSDYDDSLKPIYLFEPHDAKNHLVFIRNLNSYFKANVKVCFACKKYF